MLFGVPDEDMDKYSLLLDKSNDEIKKDIHDNCKEYYLNYMFNDADAFQVNADKLREYLALEVDAVNDYTNYCLLIVINTLIEKLYHVKGYDPVNPGFEIKRHQHKQAEYYTAYYGLSNEDIMQTIEYNRQSMDLWILRDVTDITVDVKPNIDLPGNVRGTAFANINYLGTGEDEIYYTAKMFYGMNVALGGNEDFKRWFMDDYLKRIG